MLVWSDCSLRVLERAAQTNFDKVLRRGNETIGKGMEEGAQRRIILSS